MRSSYAAVPLTLDGQQGGQCRLVHLQARSDPGGKRFCGIGPARFPGVKAFGCGNNGRVLGLHDGKSPPNS